MSEIRQWTLAELAEDAFLKRERVIGLGMMNMAPLDFDARKKAFIELAEAQKASADADYALQRCILSAAIGDKS